MTMRRYAALRRFSVLLVLVASAAPRASAIVYGGGGSSTDCLLVLNAPVNMPVTSPKQVVCTDGDPACDSDMTINGVCEVRVAACANSTVLAGCSLAGIELVEVLHADDNAQDAKFDPDFAALQTHHRHRDRAADGGFRSVHGGLGDPGADSRADQRALLQGQEEAATHHPVRRASAARSTRTRTVGVDLPPGGRLRREHAFSGTFDRIQHQVLRPELRGQRLSRPQSHAAGLLLETGAAHANLVGVTPTNPSRRVRAGSGYS